MFNTLILGFVVSLVVGLALGPIVIKKLKEFHARQEEREEGPESHKYKAGTPTMGGILILADRFMPCFQRCGYIETSGTFPYPGQRLYRVSRRFRKSAEKT